MNLRVRDIAHDGQVLARAMVVQQETQRPVQFELTEPTRVAVTAWIERPKLNPEQYLFPNRLSTSPHLSNRQHARIVYQWVAAIGLDSTVDGTHTMRRTKATPIYKRTKTFVPGSSCGHLKLRGTVKDQVCAVKEMGLRPDLLTQPIDVQEGSAWMLRNPFQDQAHRTIQEDSCMLSTKLS